MNYLLHGDDVVASRNFLSGITSGYKVIYLDGKTLKIKDFEEKLLSNSLFDEKKAVVVENLLSKNIKKKDFVKFLNEFSGTTLVALWEEKKLTKPTSSSLKKVTIKEFLLPQSYFLFLDSFAPGNAQRIYSLYQSVMLTTSPEQVFYSLIKRLRLLLIIIQSPNSKELMSMSPWQLNKIKQQSRLWSEEKLMNIYKELGNTEIKMKSGGLPLGLAKHLDILILTKLR